MLRIKELNLTCMINDSERITEKLGQWLNFSVRLWGRFVNFWVKIEVIKHMLS